MAGTAVGGDVAGGGADDLHRERPTGLTATSVSQQLGHPGLVTTPTTPPVAPLPDPAHAITRHRRARTSSRSSTADTGGNFNQLHRLPAPEFADKRYVYRVVAVNAAELLAPIQLRQFVDTPAAPPDASLPARPTGLVAGDVAHNSVSLAWDDPADTTIAHYQILRRDRDRDAPGIFAVIDADTASAATSYTSTAPRLVQALRVQGRRREHHRRTHPDSSNTSTSTTPTEPETTPDPDETSTRTRDHRGHRQRTPTR